jgi:cobaltochelatase CobN
LRFLINPQFHFTSLDRSALHETSALSAASLRESDRFAYVTRSDGAEKKIRVLEGQLFVCQGCCCGNTDKGHPPVPLEEFKAQWRERGLRFRIHLTVSGCLGPCALANVALILFGGQAIWLHSINTAGHVTAIYDYLEAMLHTGAYLPPSGLLADCHFQRFDFDAAAQAPIGCSNF